MRAKEDKGSIVGGGGGGPKGGGGTAAVTEPPLDTAPAAALAMPPMVLCTSDWAIAAISAPSSASEENGEAARPLDLSPSLPVPLTAGLEAGMLSVAESPPYPATGS